MNYPLRIFTKVGKVVQEQLAQSAFSSLVAGRIKGNYILMYHGISDDQKNIFNRRHLSYKCFIKQVKFLKKHYNVISLADYFSGNYDYTKSNFVLTFDDGYLNNFIYAKPILEQYGCPATFFITGLNQLGDNILWADYVNIASILTDDDVKIDSEVFRKKGETYYSLDTGKSIYDIIRYDRTDYDYKNRVKEAFAPHVNFKANVKFQEYWQLMNNDQVRELSNSPQLTVGSHGYFHNNLGSVSHQQALSELEKSRNYLENVTQKKIDKLAYPDGSYTLELIQACHDMGFTIQLAADKSLYNESPRNEFIKRRHGIYTVDSCLNQIFSTVNN
jgi:peptidoglycan/xylan/chitin deacetylase (PgdA/CDA1 family)